MALLQAILQAGQRAGVRLHRPSVLYTLAKFHSNSAAVDKIAWGSIDGVDTHKFVLKVIRHTCAQSVVIEHHRFVIIICIYMHMLFGRIRRV